MERFITNLSYVIWVICINGLNTIMFKCFESYVTYLPKIDLDMGHFTHAHLLKMLA